MYHNYVLGAQVWRRISRVSIVSIIIQAYLRSTISYSIIDADVVYNNHNKKRNSNSIPVKINTWLDKLAFYNPIKHTTPLVGSILTFSKEYYIKSHGPRYDCTKAIQPLPARPRNLRTSSSQPTLNPHTGALCRRIGRANVAAGHTRRSESAPLYMIIFMASFACTLRLKRLIKSVPTGHAEWARTAALHIERPCTKFACNHFNYTRLSGGGWCAGVNAARAYNSTVNERFYSM